MCIFEHSRTTGQCPQLLFSQLICVTEQRLKSHATYRRFAHGLKKWFPIFWAMANLITSTILMPS